METLLFLRCYHNIFLLFISVIRGRVLQCNIVKSFLLDSRVKDRICIQTQAEKTIYTYPFHKNKSSILSIAGICFSAKVCLKEALGGVCGFFVFFKPPFGLILSGK